MPFGNPRFGGNIRIGDMRRGPGNIGNLRTPGQLTPYPWFRRPQGGTTRSETEGGQGGLRIGQIRKKRKG